MEENCIGRAYLVLNGLVPTGGGEVLTHCRLEVDDLAVVEGWRLDTFWRHSRGRIGGGRFTR